MSQLCSVRFIENAVKIKVDLIALRRLRNEAQIFLQLRKEFHKVFDQIVNNETKRQN